MGHPHLLDNLAKTLRFLLQPTAQRGLAEKEHFRHPRHAPRLRWRQHDQLSNLRRQILLPLDEQRAGITRLVQGQQQAHGLMLLQRGGQAFPHRLQNALPHKRQLSRHRGAERGQTPGRWFTDIAGLERRQQLGRQRQQIGAKEAILRLVNHLQLNVSRQNNQLLRGRQHPALPLHNHLAAALYPTERRGEQTHPMQPA